MPALQKPAFREPAFRKTLAIVALPAVLTWASAASALPPPEDLPEEVLRTEIITGARSPIDGQPMTAAEYADLQAQLQVAPPSRPQLSRKVEKTVNLLKLRKFLKTVFPVLPIR
jgi:hypothetical protein